MNLRKFMSSVDENEIKKFASLSSDWHEKEGKFAMLHKMNKMRVSYILSNIDIYNSTILDVGCGGGLLSESLADVGAKVSAIDPCPESIEAARKFTKGNVNYEVAIIEDYVRLGKKFDVLCVMEVLEHVEDLEYFASMCVSLLSEGGKLFFSTINQTLKSFILGIVVAEYIARLVPRHTHSWYKFIKPSRLNDVFKEYNCSLQDIRGMTYNILLDKWALSQDVSVNYIGFFSFNA